MRIILFVCYCVGWLLVVSSALVTILFGAIVYLWGVTPPWVFALLGFDMEAVWERHDTATPEGTILLFVLASITIGLGYAQVWFARRFGFWLPFQSLPANRHMPEGGSFSL